MQSRDSFERTDQLVELWRTLPVREGERLPRRTAIPITKIAPILPWCWQMSWQNPEGYIIAFFGERMIEAWGTDPTGDDLFSAIEDVDIRFVTRLITTLYAQPCGAIVTREIPKGIDGRYKLTNLTLPLLDKDGYPTALFGTSVMETEQQEKPYSGKLDFVAGRVTAARFIDLGHGLPADNFLSANA